MMERHQSSFRDPSGFVVCHEGEFLRVVNPIYRSDYDLLMGSGLYRDLAAEKLLVTHEELPATNVPAGAYKLLRSRQIPFFSYPYEWCFSQLKDAALATLAVQKAALDHGMSLKDASAYNIQFIAGRATLIDTLSFETLKVGEPWVAYHQFCRHFLAPLALMARSDVRLLQLFRIHLDGVPLDLAQNLLPASSRLSPWLLLHIHLHARSHRRSAGKTIKGRLPKRQFSQASFRGLLESLESAVRSLKFRGASEVWSQYYDATVTGGKYLQHKQELVGRYLEQARPATVWDLGANRGLFSFLAASKGAETFAFDGDHDCVEMAYQECRRRSEAHLLPLWLDLANPSPALGWANTERSSWLERAQPDLVMALALVHHLAIGNNLPLGHIADFFARLGRWLIVEFVPKDDENAQKLLQVREDIFSEYTEPCFAAEFARRFEILESQRIHDSARMLYLMRRK